MDVLVVLHRAEQDLGHETEGGEKKAKMKYIFLKLYTKCSQSLRPYPIHFIEGVLEDCLRWFDIEYSLATYASGTLPCDGLLQFPICLQKKKSITNAKLARASWSVRIRSPYL
jgi:hypothetical protein